jgi:PAS domain S-box-containing protein
MRLANEQRIILNASSVGICFVKERKLIWANPAYDMMFGYETGTTRGMDSASFYGDSKSYEEVGINGYATIESGAIYSHDVMMKKKDGTLIWCNLVGQAVSPGNMAEGSIWVVLDVTERKQVARLLAENEIRLRTLVQTIPDLVWLKDVDGVYLACNRMFERFFGAKEADIVGKTDYDFVDKELADFFREHDRKAMAAGGPSSNEEWINFADNGQRALLETIKVPMCDRDGQLIGVLGIARDITDRKQIEESNLEMERKFQQTQKLESLGVLAGGIAHDFNNVLTIILGHCYIVDEEIDSGIDLKYHIRQVKTAAERAADLCRQMLSYAGKNTLVQSRINLWALVDENVKMLRSAIKKNVTFNLDLTNDVPEIIGDSAQIQQVVMNLIINAAEAIGSENGTIKITLNRLTVQDPDHQGVRDNEFSLCPMDSENGFLRTYDQPGTVFPDTAVPPGTYACLTVSDNGCGMDLETQKRLFEPFYTTKFTGRGLGMSAVLGIIKSHEGSLKLSSTPGVGTTFRVCLPLSGDSDRIEIAPEAAHVSSVKGSGTILLVDDEEALLIIGSVLLKVIGYSAITAANGREALEIFREQGCGIDLVLLDLIMPEMSGVDAYRRLREISSTIPIVFCSGYSDDEINPDIIGDEHAALIHKPYRPDQLRDTLTRLLDKKK